jgi:hypothetical protein
MNLRLVSVAIALVLSAMLLGAGVYESVVVAPNFQGAPISLEHARGFYHATNPGLFFGVLSAATQLLLLVALVCNWGPVPVTRWRLAGALALAILADVITLRGLASEGLSEDTEGGQSVSPHDGNRRFRTQPMQLGLSRIPAEMLVLRWPLKHGVNSIVGC